MNGADARRIADTGATIYQNKIVASSKCTPLRFQELPTTKPFVEIVPIERIHPLRIVFVLHPGRNEVDDSIVLERPVQSDDVAFQRGEIRGDLGLGDADSGGVPNVVDKTGCADQLTIKQEGPQIAMKTRGLKIPINKQNPVPITGQDPSN